MNKLIVKDKKNKKFRTERSRLGKSPKVNINKVNKKIFAEQFKI